MLETSYPSLLDLPAELIFHIIQMLPQSSYHKCLNVCKRLNAIENEYVIDRSVMCICRFHEYSPNLPSHELKLLLCMSPETHQLKMFIKLIRRRPLTCNTTIIGQENDIQDFQNYLKRYIEHPNVKIFLENSKTNVASPLKHEWYKSIDLQRREENELQTEYVASYLEMSLGEDEDLIQRFSNMLRTSCFRKVIIACNSINLRSFIRSLKNYCQIFDVIDFQKAVISMKIDHVTSMPIDVDLLSSYQNLDQLFFTINELDLGNVRSRLLELTQCFQQANLRKLTNFVLYENSPLVFSKDFILVWENLFKVIPSNELELLEIRSKTDLHSSNENHLTKQFESSNSLSLANGILRLEHLQFLTVHHLGFDITLIRILPFLKELRKLDLCINIDMSNKNLIKELSENFENCINLEDITVYLLMEQTMTFGNVFTSLAKLQQLNKLNLYLDSLNITLTVECFEKLKLIKNLREMKIYIKKTEYRYPDVFHWLGQNMKRQIVQFVPQDCEISICQYN